MAKSLGNVLEILFFEKTHCQFYFRNLERNLEFLPKRKESKSGIECFRLIIKEDDIFPMSIRKHSHWKA